MKLEELDLEERLLKKELKILSTYKNFKQKYEFECLKCNSLFNSTLDCIFQRKNNGCKSCSKKESNSKQKLDYNDVVCYFDEKNCILLESEYLNSHQKMMYICSCGSISEINFNNFKNGRRCKKCAIQKISGTNNYGWIKNRQEYELRKRIRCFCYSSIKRCLNSNKIAPSYDYLGYSPIDLISHIKSHKNWADLCNKEWHIDHIFPIKAFFDNQIYDVKVINRLDNIQPILAKNNLKKNSKYSKRKFKDYLENIGYLKKDGTI